MPLFILALLALAAAAEEEAKPPEYLPGPKEPVDPSLHDPQMKALFFWNYLDTSGNQIVLWNERQNIAWLLDTLVCPQGHANPEYFSYIDQLEYLVSPMSNETPSRARHEDREYRDFGSNVIGPTLWCYHPDHVGDIHGCTLPEHVWKEIETGPCW